LVKVSEAPWTGTFDVNTTIIMITHCGRDVVLRRAFISSILLVLMILFFNTLLDCFDSNS